MVIDTEPGGVAESPRPGAEDNIANTPGGLPSPSLIHPNTVKPSFRAASISWASAQARCVPRSDEGGRKLDGVARAQGVDPRQAEGAIAQHVGRQHLRPSLGQLLEQS